MASYKAALFAPDGGWVTDHKRASVDDVWEAIGDQGSRWYFYPIAFVIRDRGALTTSTQRIVAAPEGFEYLQGCTIATVKRTLADIPQDEWEAILS